MSAKAGAWGAPSWVWSALALMLGIGLSLWAAAAQHEASKATRAQALAEIADNSHDALVDRLQAGELLVRAVQTLFLTSQEVRVQEFANLYANLKPRKRFPSLMALAYADRVMHADGMHYITTLVMPIAGNERVVGLDVGQQPTNLAAVFRSRDSNQAVMSAPFRLVQATDPDAIADGVTLRLPVYAAGAPPRGLEERRRRMQGSIAASFRVGDLIESALPPEVRERMHIRVTDVTGGGSSLLYDSDPASRTGAARRLQRRVNYGGRVWQLAMQPRGIAPINWSQSVLGPGLLASALLALLVWSVVNTNRRAHAQALRMSSRYRESETRFRALNELLPALVLLADDDDGGRINYANQASRLRLGEAIGEVTLSSLFEDDEFRAQLRGGVGGSCSSAEAVLRSTNGDRFWATVSIAPVQLDGRGMLLIVASDISEQRQLTELLSYQATHDALTELYNRREFERRLERALLAIAAGGPPGALLYIDLDQFKLINDTSGHIAGDQLLSQLAATMRDQLRGGDVLARLGGDEFGVLAANVQDLHGAQLVAERLRERIDGYVFVWEQRTYTVSASIGGVMLDQSGGSLSALLAQADTACYMAKEAGRNRVHFYSAQDDETARRHTEMEWANRLRWAIDERRLLLKYQELWPLSSDADTGAHIELLLRFRDEAGRLVVPGAFLPAAERYGLMPMIDRWVIETALSNFDRLHPSGAALAMATINLSGASVEDESLVELILSLLDKHQVEPQRICFEITETVAVRNLSQVSRFIERLRAVGCRFALDDFGAGMSSFGYLKNLPVDIIKIDGSFIRDLLSDPMSHSIVRAVTEIGHQRGMWVIAEWVSSEPIVRALVEIGVDYAQGFSLHRPQPTPLHRALADAKASHPRLADDTDRVT